MKSLSQTGGLDFKTASDKDVFEVFKLLQQGHDLFSKSVHCFDIQICLNQEAFIAEFIKANATMENKERFKAANKAWMESEIRARIMAARGGVGSLSMGQMGFIAGVIILPTQTMHY